MAIRPSSTRSPIALLRIGFLVPDPKRTALESLFNKPILPSLLILALTFVKNWSKQDGKNDCRNEYLWWYYFVHDGLAINQVIRLVAHFQYGLAGCFGGCVFGHIPELGA